MASEEAMFHKPNSTVWEDGTLSPTTLSLASSEKHFQRFLQEGIAKKLSLITEQWLELPMAESPYQSWYLGMANGYHLFNLQAENDPQLNLLVFDSSGRIRDRHVVAWGEAGGSLDFVNAQVLQINLYNQGNITDGIDQLNLLIDLNGQFQQLTPSNFIHPSRKFPELSGRIIQRNFFESYDKVVLEEMIHEVLAANGKVFSDPVLQKQFEHTDWYVPGPIDEDAELLAIESYNLENLKIILDGK